MTAAPIKLALLICSIVLTIGISSWIKINKDSAQPDVEKTITGNTDFNEDNFNFVKTDTFINLLTKAYHQNISSRISQNRLFITLKGANAITRDFFNGNDALLNNKLKDHGFEISYNKNENTVSAIFKITGDAVPVPNDVLIKIADKIVN